MRKLFVLIVPFLFFACNKDKIVYQKLQGDAFGTTFNIMYEDINNKDLSKGIDSIIYTVNKSLSTYIFTSDISRINRGDSSVQVDEMFQEVFYKSEKIYKETDGLFDPTLGIIVNAWGFGPEKVLKNPSKKEIDSMLNFVGFNKVRLENNKVIKQDSNIYFDFNSIAKGYGIDRIGKYIEKHNCKNYRIELGGEIRARGVDPNGNFWRVWLDEPNFEGERILDKFVQLNNQSMASSGNYRKFKIDENGNKFVHTINAKTGMAIESNLLAATVVNSGDCADVDGYATAFMAMGFEKSKAFLDKHEELLAFLVYIDENGETKTYTTEGLLVTNR